MIVCLSITDKHKPLGMQHVGSVLVEVDIPIIDTHYDVLAMVVAADGEQIARNMGIGRVMSKADMIAEGGAINGLGEEVT